MYLRHDGCSLGLHLRVEAAQVIVQAFQLLVKATTEHKSGVAHSSPKLMDVAGVRATFAIPSISSTTPGTIGDARDKCYVTCISRRFSIDCVVAVRERDR